jgi:hypothetical protein
MKAASKGDAEKTQEATVVHNKDEHTFVIIGNENEFIVPINKLEDDINKKEFTVPPELNDGITVKIPYQSD